MEETTFEGNFDKTEAAMGLIGPDSFQVSKQVQAWPRSNERSDLLFVFARHQILPWAKSWNACQCSEELLTEALTHRSFCHERADLIQVNNERLEFLGDAVLNLLISDQLIENMPKAKEGKLSKIRAALVNEQSLSELARALEIDRYLLVGKGQLQTLMQNQSAQSTVLADTFEAILGANYLAQGLIGAKRCLQAAFEIYQERWQRPFLSLERLESFDAKTRLQELTMALYKEWPVYTTEYDGQLYWACVQVKEEKWQGEKCSSKKKAQHAVAAKALAHLEKLKEEKQQ